MNSTELLSKPYLFVRTIVRCVLIHILVATVAVRVDAQASRIGLIIAVGKYPAVGKYKPINARNDVPLIRSVLAAQRFNEVRELLDEDATKAGIVAALEKLTADAKAGDLVHLHYAGHGHQITDDNGDESDGYDELLVPYDAPNFARLPQTSPAYRGQQHIRDDQLRTLLDNLRLKLGTNGTLLFTVDACFSGTIARGSDALEEPAPVRGELAPIGPAATTTRPSSLSSPFSELVDIRAANMSPLILMTAAREDELDQEVYDGKGWVGPLSYALAIAYPKLRPEDSYEVLFSKVRAQIRIWRPSQSPQIEGPSGLLIYGGGLVEYPVYYEAAVRSRGTEISLSAGQIHGITRGSELAFFAPGTSAPVGKPLAIGTVTSANATTALLTPSGYTGEVDKLNGAWGFPRKLAPAGQTLRISIQASLSERSKELSRTAIASDISTAILVDSAPDLFIGHIDTPRGSSLAVVIPVSSTSSNVGSIPVLGALVANEHDTVRALSDRVRAYASARNMLSLPIFDAKLSIALVLRPALLRIEANGQCTPDTTSATTTISVGGVWRASASIGSQSLPRVMQGFVLETRNDSEEDLWISVLDIGPQMSVKILAPRKEEAAGSMKLARRSRASIQACFAFSPIPGKETLLMIATRSPVDFSTIVTRNTTTARATLDDVSRLFADLYFATRSVGAVPYKVGTMFPLFLEILPLSR